MRRLISVAGLMALAFLLPIQSASAGGRVGPPLNLQLYVFEGVDSGGNTASLVVDGTGCVPLDAPASVMVTLDRAPGQVFTTKPDARGRWSVSIPVDTPVDGVYVVNATCDNYFGTTTYPTAQTNADEVIFVAAGEGAGGSNPPPSTRTVEVTSSGGGIANTGAHTGGEIGIGTAALVLGSLLVLLGLPRRALRPILTRRDVGRHRRDH